MPKISKLTAATTVGDTDTIVIVQSGVTKKAARSLVGALGDVLGPATNTANYIPQWDGANSKKIKDGLALVTTVGATGADTSIVSEQGVREALNDKAPKLFDHHIQASTATLTVAKVSGTVISNYGQGAENTQTLPAAAAGYNGLITIATAGAGAFHLKAGASDKIYLDGTALDDGDKASLATPAIGDYFSFWSFQTGATAYDWIVSSGQGTLTDGGA